MNKKIMGVDKDQTVHEQQKEAWEKIGVESIRVDTMNEAIDKIIKGGEFLFIAINEDTIPDFWEQLRLMRDVTDDQIYIITSSYEVAKHTKAVNYGADTYGAFAKDASGDVAAGIALLELQNKRGGRKNPKTPVLASGGVVLSKSRHLVFVNDVKIELQKKEFDILALLMENNGCFVDSKKLFETVWGEEYSENANNSLRKAISNLRSKLSEASTDGTDYIIAKWDVGYKFFRQ
jgi:DNA-binding response OmpR family regulator